MEEEERKLIIEWLAMWSNWSKEALCGQSDQKLLSEYERHGKLNKGMKA